jgi:hypothetical protein
MNSIILKLVWRGGLIALLATGPAGCSTYYRDGPPLYSSAYYHYPYRYYYYPGTDIYYHLSSGDYYYSDGRRWKRDKQLPPQHQLDHRDRVQVWIDSDKPQDRHKEHQRKYKPSPRYERDSVRDRNERRHNLRQHERYRDR